MATKSSAIKMGGGGSEKKAKPQVSQSIPAHFYRNYKPPATPKINPQPQPASALPDFAALPKISGGGMGINLGKTGSFSMTKNTHPMSMPARSKGLMGPRGTPFTVKAPAASTDGASDKAQPELKEHKEEQAESNSLVERTQQLKIGSYTCLDLMGGGAPLKQVSEASADKDVASAQQAASGSVLGSDSKTEVAPEPEESEEDDMAFDME